jgi:O-antigen/teichoic acid export membrane protein
MKHQLQTSVPFIRKDLFRAITPNAVKMGLTSLGGFMVVKAAIIIGSMYLSLSEIASYSVTLQLIGIISGLAGIYFGTYQPKIVQLTIELNKTAVKQIYLRSFFVILFSFFVGGLGMLLFAKWALVFIGSKTQLIPDQMILAALVISFLESNHVLAGGVLLSKNEVPFLIPSLLSGSLTILLLLAFFRFFEAGIWPMILAPGIAQALYQNWKWPLVVSKELKITATDFADTLLTPLKLYFHETCKSTNR